MIETLLCLALCAWADAPKALGAVRDPGFCQESVPIPAFVTSSKQGYYADKLDPWGMPVCLDKRGGLVKF